MLAGNGYPGNDVVVAPGNPFYPAQQWRIFGRDEERFWEVFPS